MLGIWAAAAGDTGDETCKIGLTSLILLQLVPYLFRLLNVKLLQMKVEIAGNPGVGILLMFSSGCFATAEEK